MARTATQLKRTASTTLALGNIIATANRRLALYDLIVGSEATPADNPFTLLVRRCTTVGTATAVTPVALDPANPSGGVTQTANENHTVDPTITANSELLDIPFNQRATFRWVAAPDGELIVPAVASNGLVLSTPVAPAVLISAMLHVNEI